MTLLINKAESTTRLLVTATELNATTSGNTMDVFNQATNVSASYDLPPDSSVYPLRYNEFILLTSTFSGLTSGHYDYVIRDSISNVVESGVLEVVDDVQSPVEEVASEYTYITPADGDDDFIIYQP